MYKTLYEAGFKFEFDYLIPVIIIIGCLCLPTVIKKIYENQNKNINIKIVKRFCSIAFCFVIILCLITTTLKIDEYNSVISAYHKGDYMVVEGYVEDFIPMPYEGHSNESFMINGVEFSYSDYELQFGYNNTKSHGGVITGNNQHFRIGYVQYNGNNKIVLVEHIVLTE